MKIKDIIWGAILLLFTSLILIPYTRYHFEQFTTQYPYIMGFIKTAILATMGELLVHRIKTKSYFHHKGILLKMIVWGFLGMIFVLVFKIFSSGVSSAQESGLLISINHDFWGSVFTAFLISFWMNIWFAPSFMLLHRLTDAWIDLSKGSVRALKTIQLNQMIDTIDFKYFFSFVIFKTIPFFWIPAHTITFMLPETYRVLMASYLSICLGIILTYAKNKSKKQT